MEYFFLFAGIVLVLIFLSFLLKTFLNRAKENDSPKKEADFVRCPLCNSALLKGENLHSKIFRPMNTPDQRMTVQGCPHCFPTAESGISRKCPVCGKSVAQNEELVARLFNRNGGKKHVMITGCSKCCRKNAR